MIPLSSQPWIFDILGNLSVYVTLVIFVAMAIGLASRSMAVGSLAGYTTFAYIASQMEQQLYTNILIVTLVLISVGFAFKFWRVEGMGGES